MSFGNWNDLAKEVEAEERNENYLLRLEVVQNTKNYFPILICHLVGLIVYSLHVISKINWEIHITFLAVFNFTFNVIQHAIYCDFI